MKNKFNLLVIILIITFLTTCGQTIKLACSSTNIPSDVKLITYLMVSYLVGLLLMLLLQTDN
jgi:hypothetical protein